MAIELRVTWIAPTIPGLPVLAWLEELAGISTIPGVTVTTRTGEKLTLGEVSNVLRLPADVVVWSGHGKEGGLCLPNDVLVQPRWLATQVAGGCFPKVVVLAACGSQLRAQDLRSLVETLCRAGINAVGFPAATDDIAAARFTVELVRALASNANIAVAFDVALESIGNESTAKGVTLTPGIGGEPFNLDMRLKVMEERLVRIEARLGTVQPLPAADSVRTAGPAEATAGETETAGGIQSLPRVKRGKTSNGHIRGLGNNLSDG
jgi:hypothetical protein